MPFRAVTIGILLLCWPFLAGAEAVVLQDGKGVVDAAPAEVPLVPWAKIIKDADRELTSDRVLALPARGSAAEGTRIASFGFSGAVYWFSLSLDNPGAAPLQRLLVFDPTWLDQVEVTLVRPDGTTQVFRGGDRLAFGQRAEPHRKINFALALPPGQSRLVVRTQTDDPFVVAMTLWEKSAFYAADSGEAGYFGLVYGALGALLVFNLILFLSVREGIYAAYVAYLLAFLVMHATYNGHLYPLLWPNSPAWDNWAHSIFIYLFMMAGLVFAIQFLELRTRLAPAYRWAKWLTLALIVSFALTAQGGYGLHVSSAILWVMVYSPFVLVLGVWSLLKGNRAARYFLTAAMAGFVGSFITALTVAGLIPYSLYGYRAVDIGMLLDAALLSLALADRLRLSRLEAEEAKTQLIETTRSYALQLEDAVAERTHELRQANAVKDRFFSIVAHDLRGPIEGLAMFFRVLKSGKDFTADRLETIRATVENTRDFLDELLTWARNQRGEIDCHPVAVDMGRLLAEIQELYSTQAQAKGVRLNLETAEDCWVFADPAMTRTVLRNLTHNALKFTRKGGSVTASITPEQDGCRVSITDTGVGMDAEMRRSVFRLNAKTRGSPSTDGEAGTGLGLILCKEFVEKNSGAIGVMSEVGKGSTFWFRLPPAQAPEITDQRVVLEKLGTLRVLIAEDDALHRESGAQILRELGCSAAFAANGAEAVRLAAEETFDLILMDIDMPRVDGVEATKQIRASGSRCPIVALSSYSRRELMQRAGEIEFDDYLYKPLTKDTLIMAVAGLISGAAHAPTP